MLFLNGASPNTNFLISMFKIILQLFFVHTLFIVTVNGSPVKNSLLPKECGIDAPPRILGGTVTKLGEFPWTALLQRADGSFACGGVLISERYILTAAHCSGKVPIVSVRLGEHNLDTEEDCDVPVDAKIKKSCIPKPIDITVENIISHDQYTRNPDPTINTDDITLIRLAEAVNFTRTIKPICLPMKELTEADIGKNATVAGWGKTETRAFSPVKLKLEISIKPNHECKLADDVKQLCAGGQKGKGSCAGDSGGPLMVHKNDDDEYSWYLIGIVSYGSRDCGKDGIPDVYTKVGDYIDWIIDKIKP